MRFATATTSCSLLLLLATTFGCGVDGAADAGSGPDGGPPLIAHGDGAAAWSTPTVNQSPGAAAAGGANAFSCQDGWCRLGAGQFIMGSPPTESCRHEEEWQHEVTLSSAFELSQKEVTWGDFTALMSDPPAGANLLDLGQQFCTKECYLKREDQGDCLKACPMANVTWHQAAAYCNRLSLQQLDGQCQICTGEGNTLACRKMDPAMCQCYRCTGEGTQLRCEPAPQFLGDKIYSCSAFRLPTEAEWEYAYRAGSRTALYNGPISHCDEADEPNAGTIGWYKRNAYLNIGPNVYLPLHPGMQQRSNSWGLYDMAGNLSEWTHSLYAPYPDAAGVTNPNPRETLEGNAPNGYRGAEQRVLRGGSYRDPAAGLRAAARAADSSVSAQPHYGFRCARTIFNAI